MILRVTWGSPLESSQNHDSKSQLRFLRNRAPAEAKSRVLRVWRSAWELKIDTKKFQDKEDNDLEEERETIHATKETKLSI